MKKITCHLAAVALVGGLVAFSVSAAESLSVLLQKGIYAEETEGNLDAAIQIYEGIVKEADANRSLVAQAQYRLGVCELKRGKKEAAEAAFRKIIGQFSDQSEITIKAGERLGEMGKIPFSVVVRQVWFGESASGERISTDGRHLAFIDSETSNLAVRDLATGATRRLTDDASWATPSQFPTSCVISPNGDEIAYTWDTYFQSTNWSTGVRIVNVRDRKQRVLIPQQTNHWFSVEDWSADGKAIALSDAERDRVRTNWIETIAVVSVADGAIRRIAAEDGGFDTLRFSRDGNYLAYNATRIRLGSTSRLRTNDIVLLDVRTRTKKVAVEHLSKEQFVSWTPNGSEILFTSERSGTTALWSVGIEKGGTRGFPKLVKSGLPASISPIGITHEGALFYKSRVSGSSDLYSAVVDFVSGRLLSPPKQITMGIPDARSPRPSDDGKLLAFIHGSYPRPKFAIKDLVKGEVREYAVTNFNENSMIQFSTNHDYLLIRGITHDGSADNSNDTLGYYLFNRASGEMRPLTTWQRSANMNYGDVGFRLGAVHYVQWEPRTERMVDVQYDIQTRKRTEHELSNPPSGLQNYIPSGDRRHVFLLATNRSESETTIWRLTRRETSSGSEIELFRSTNRCELRALNPNRPIAIRMFRPDGSSTLKALDLEDNHLNERFSVELPARIDFVQWRWFGEKPHLLFLKTVGHDAERAAEFWTISADDGRMKKTELTVPHPERYPLGPTTFIRAYDIRVAGEGENEIFFEKGDLRSYDEISVMENFLPPVAAAK